METHVLVVMNFQSSWSLWKRLPPMQISNTISDGEDHTPSYFFASATSTLSIVCRLPNISFTLRVPGDSWIFLKLNLPPCHLKSIIYQKPLAKSKAPPVAFNSPSIAVCASCVRLTTLLGLLVVEVWPKVLSLTNIQPKRQTEDPVIAILKAIPNPISLRAWRTVVLTIAHPHGPSGEPCNIPWI